MTTYIRYANTQSIEEWANNTLNQQELQQFRTANEENKLLWKEYNDQGLVFRTDILETVFSNTFNLNVEVRIGHKITLSSDSSTGIVIAPSLVPWIDRYDYEVGNPVITE